ncbi:uncharacterized protein BDV14DRAFT_6517 [Aspergillus stella-maris]|uniref:uncharacterized protein n=1 Tax=Aspergillus stella-maris TaxID=1810926 RepID=UPI003CCD3009
MRPTTLLPLYLFGTLPRAIAVRLNITEVRWTDGRPSRTQIIDVPYIDQSLLPKDQPCPALPFLTKEVTLLTDDLIVPTECWLYTQLCHNSLQPIDSENPYALLINSAFAVRCYDESQE